MIRKYVDSDIDAVMQIWLNTNIQAHGFISPDYWKNNFDVVKEMLPLAEIYVYEDDCAKEVKSTLRLSVYRKNEKAIKFYLREKFNIQSENVDDNTGETEFIMAWKH